jgi:hypothetical protein
MPLLIWRVLLALLVHIQMASSQHVIIVFQDVSPFQGPQYAMHVSLVQHQWLQAVCVRSAKGVDSAIATTMRQKRCAMRAVIAMLAKCRQRQTPNVWLAYLGGCPL